MLRLALLAALTVALAPVTADAHDCISTCGDICYAVPESAFYRAEILSTNGGYTSRVRLVERLGGEASVAPAIGEERDDIYTEIEVQAGEHVFLTLSRHTETGELYVWNVARPIRLERVMCGDDPEIELAQYVGMAESDRCESIAEDLDIANECSDTHSSPGCTSAASGSLGGALMLLVLALRRRRRCANGT